MNELKKTSQLVKVILENDKQTRNSDSLLYMKVLSAVGERKGIDLGSVSVPHFLLKLHGTAFPPFESVRRARQKIQAAHPELAACEAVEGFRAENEAEFRAYARGEA